MIWPAPTEATAWLQQQGVKPTEVAALLRAAGGRPDDALGYAQAGLDTRAWSQLPKALARGDGGPLADWSPAQAVDALSKLCHDLLAVKAGAAPRFFAAADLPPAGSFAALTGWSRELVRTARTVEHPFNAGLMLENLVNRARLALNSRS